MKATIIHFKLILKAKIKRRTVANRGTCHGKHFEVIILQEALFQLKKKKDLKKKKIVTVAR